MKIQKITERDVATYLLEGACADWDDVEKSVYYYANVNLVEDGDTVSAVFVVDGSLDSDFSAYVRADFDWDDPASWGEEVEEDAEDDEDEYEDDYYSKHELCDFYDVFESMDNPDFIEVIKELTAQINDWLEEEYADTDVEDED